MLCYCPILLPLGSEEAVTTVVHTKVHRDKFREYEDIIYALSDLARWVGEST